MKTKTAVVLVTAMIITSCGEQRIASPSVAPPDTASPPSSALQRIACSAVVSTREVKCGQPPTGVQGDLILGNQTVYVTLTSSNVAYNAGTGAFTFDVTVTNLIGQSLGTKDGTNPDPNGIRAFFHAGPTVTGGTGNVSVTGDGSGTFTASNQPYYLYGAALLGADGILVTNEVSQPRTWQIDVDPTVTSFNFFIYITTAVRHPDGYVLYNTPPAVFMNTPGTQTVDTPVSYSAVGAVQTGVTFTYTSSATGVATVDPSGVITGVAPGATSIIVMSSSLAVDTIPLMVCPGLAIGEVYTTSGAAAAATCVGGYVGASEYTAIPNNQAASSVTLSILGTGIQAVTGPPTPDRIPGAGVIRLSELPNTGTPTHEALGAFGDADVTPGSTVPSGAAQASNLIHEVASAERLSGPHSSDDDGFAAPPSDSLPPAEGIMPAAGAKRRLMWYPTEAAKGRVPAPVVSMPGAIETITKATPVVGDTVAYNVASGCSGTPDIRTGVVRSVGVKAVIVADTANPVGGFTTAQYDSIKLEYDSIADFSLTPAFGSPTDIDGNGRVILFFTRKLNELSPPASSSVVLGYFNRVDVNPVATCNLSNAAEIIYMLVPDPTGTVNSNVRTVSFVRGNTIGTSGHELARLINAFRRTYVSFAPLEAAWLDEGLAHLAEELMFYRTSVGLTPRVNITLSTLTTGPNASRRVAAFNTYANQNYGRFRSWLQRPDTAGVSRGSGSGITQRGVNWAFLRYAADRFSPATTNDYPFISALVNNSDTGMVNLQAVIGAPPGDWIRDFELAMYGDDNAFSVATTYQNPSWNFRSVYGGLGGFPLLARPLTNTVTLTLAYKAGGSAFTRFGVPAAGFGTITVLQPGAVPPPSTVSWSIMRTK